MTDTKTSVQTIVAAAAALADAGRWPLAVALLDATVTDDPDERALLALTAAGVAWESDWHCGTTTMPAALTAAAAAVDAAGGGDVPRWDLAYHRMRHTYLCLLTADGVFRPGPWGKDPPAVAALRSDVLHLRATAPDDGRCGWAHMHVGLVLDNICGERDDAPASYAEALAAGERVDDPRLVREALRHLGDHDHDDGDHAAAETRWSQAASAAARAGLVPGTLGEQLHLAVLARDAGDEPGAQLLAGEIERWATALGLTRLAGRATAFRAGVDPTAPPPEAAA